MLSIKDGTTEFEVKDMRYKAIVDLIYPVGTVIAFAKDEEPPVLKYGEWEEVPAGRFLQSAFGAHKAGEEIEAGLPNIKGTTSAYPQFPEGWSGAMFFTEVDTEGANVGASWPSHGYLNFDASRSSPIYGASDTVQPPAYIVHFYERVK